MTADRASGLARSVLAFAGSAGLFAGAASPGALLVVAVLSMLLVALSAGCLLQASRQNVKKTIMEVKRTRERIAPPETRNEVVADSVPQCEGQS
jgi:hypothetical protein